MEKKFTAKKLTENMPSLCRCEKHEQTIDGRIVKFLNNTKKLTSVACNLEIKI